jgi:glycine/D-amino acid oxidase-like deaminating enzyme
VSESPPAFIPVWRDARDPEWSSTEIPNRVDVAVVGGGVIGLTAMHHLVTAGASAVLIEAGQPGAGSSTTGSGVVGWSRTIADPGAIDPRASGSDDVAATVAGAQQWFARFIQHHRLDADLTIPGSVHLAGPSDPGPLGTVDPRRLIEALMHAIVARGGAAAFDEPLRSASHHTRGFQLLTSRRKISAHNVIMAAGAAPGPYPMTDLRKRYRPRRGRCIVFTSERLDPMLPEGATTYSRAPDVRALRRLSRTAALLWFPDLTKRRSGLPPSVLLDESAPGLDATITHDWPDRYATTHDGLPRIGRINGVWYAGGAADPALTALLGDHVAGLTIGSVASSPFAEIPHDYAITSRLRRTLTGR